MAKLVCSGQDIGFTVLPYSLDTPLQQELSSHRSDYVLGYIMHNKETGERKFTYAESGAVEMNEHWSLSILKEFPYCEQNGPWIVYMCSPEKTESAFGKILSQYSQTLHIHNWDIWSVEDKNAKVAVINSWEIY